MAGTVSWGIVGCGDVANRKSGGAFARIPGCRLVSAMRRDAAKAEAFAARHGAPHWTTDARETIHHPEVDAVYVATPPSHHLEYALAVADAGKPCLVEKPAGRSLAEFGRMRDAFRAAGLPLFVSYYRPFLPRYRKVEQILRSGALGPIVGIQYRMCKRPRLKGWALDVATSGGGYFYDLAGHVLDVFDTWFGPLELDGASAANALPAGSAEDVVSLSFRTPDGAVGSCLWNFASSESRDDLVIDGIRGRITMQGTSVDKPVRVSFEPNAKRRLGQTLRERKIAKWRKRLRLASEETHRFPSSEWPHEPMLADFTRRIAEGREDNADAALRTATIVDRALSPYYGGRGDAFWDRPSTWRSLRAQASRRNQGPLPEEYRLSEGELLAFERDGYTGPFRCDAAWEDLPVPIRTGRNRHLEESDVFRVCTHPSVIRRVAQVMGRPRFSLFKSRFVVKLPASDSPVPWHQDVGDHNGGFTADGKAVPTVALWMALDDVGPDNGGLELLPGTHRTLVGDYNKQIHSQLVESGTLGPNDLKCAVPVPLRRGEFILFHGWLIHGSGPNESGRRRAALNMRFTPPGLEYEDEFVYIPIETGPVQESNRVFMNDVWGGKADDLTPARESPAP
jgi:predicted dehydrogenase